MRELVTVGANQVLLEALQRYQVRFLVVGGLAVHFYDPTREVGDLDLLAEPTLQNARRLVTALRTVHVFPDPGAAERFAEGGFGFHLKNYWSLYADILSEPVEAFAEHWAAASDAVVGSVPVKVASAATMLEHWSRSPPGRADDIDRLRSFLAKVRTGGADHGAPHA